jgi:hypothetical protein
LQLFYCCRSCTEKPSSLCLQALPARSADQQVYVLRKEVWEPIPEDTKRYDYPAIEPPAAVADAIAGDLGISEAPSACFRSDPAREQYVVLFGGKENPFTS